MSSKKQSNKKAAIRVDSSFKIGVGHLMRCLTLADELANQSFEVTFFSRHMPDRLVDLIYERKHQFVSIDTGEEDCDENNLYESWLECSEEVDSTAFLNKAQGTFDLLVVDHYGLSEKWEKRVKYKAKKIFVIDDLANRKHDCDYILDQNCYPEIENRYSGLVPDTCIRFMGPHYSLLKPDFSEYRKKLNRDDSKINILVFYGGADPTSETLKFLEAIDSEYRNNPSWDNLTVVIGESNRDKKDIERIMEKLLKAELHVNTPHMANLTSCATVSFCAGGTFTWERFCLGVPAFVTTNAENQLEGAHHLAKEGLICYLGHYDMVDKKALLGAMSQLDSGLDFMNQQKVKIMKLVDGEGSLKIVNSIQSY
jgi:UDP-2,4-diacetamido-2,4,6-trideoxy-beta-L-altropyranose hydrolase